MNQPEKASIYVFSKVQHLILPAPSTSNCYQNIIPSISNFQVGKPIHQHGQSPYSLLFAH
jgi:hypothetical protein